MGAMKALTYAVVTTTLVFTSGVASILPVAAATIVDGDLVKVAGTSAVYLIQGSTKRVFPHYNVYLSQGYPANFSTVKTVSSSDLASYTDGTAVPFRDGSLFRGIATSLHGKDASAVFVVSDGKLRPIKSAEIYQALYNDANWNYVTWVPDDLLSKFNYTLGDDVTSSAIHPNGSIIKYAGSGALYLIQNGLKRAFTSWDAYTANRFDKSNAIVPVLTVTESYSDGSNISGAESALVTPGAGPSTALPGGLTVALASDTPAAGSAVKNAQRVNFTKINLTATGGDVTVNSLSVKRGGLGADTNFSEIIITDMSGNLLDNEKTLNAEHTVTFTKEIKIASGTTKSIYLAANMATAVTAGDLATLSLTAIATKDNATINASLPITGNVLTMNSTTIGTVTVYTSGASSNPSAQTKKVGTTSYIFTSVKVSADSAEDQQIESVRWNQASTAADSDITNLALLVDGVAVKTGGALSNKEVIFDLSADPVKLTKGTSKEVSIRGDITSGSDRTVSFGFSKKTDVKIKGLSYGFYIAPTYDATNDGYYIVGPLCTIGIGTLTATKATITSLYVAPGATQAELSAFYLQALGEPVIISRLVLDVATDSAHMTNIKIFDENGTRVAGPIDPGTNAVGSFATSTDTFTVPVGTHKYTIKGDLKSTTGIWVSNDSLAIVLKGNLITAKGEVTNQTITNSPNAALALDTLTVKTGALTVRTLPDPAAQSVVKGTQNWIFAKFTFDTTASGEDVRITGLTLKHTSTKAGLNSDIQNIILYDGSTALNAAVQGSEESVDATMASTATTTITLLNNLDIPKGTVKTLILKANISGSATAAGHQYGIVRAANVTAKGVATGTTITPTVTASDGQLQTVVAGGTVDLYTTASTPGSSILVGDTTNNTVQTIQAFANYENVQLTDIGLTIAGSGSNPYTQVSNISITDGTNTWTTTVSSNNATISPTDAAPLIIPVNGSKVLTIKASTNTVGKTKVGTSGDTFTIKISNIEEKGVSSGSTSLTYTGLNTASNTMYVFATKPTVAKVDLGSTTSVGNAKELYKFTVSANAKGDVGFYKATFEITTSSATVTNFRWYEIYGDNDNETDLSYQEATWLGFGTTTSYEIITAGTAGSGGIYRLNAYINTSANTMPGFEYTTIPAGGSKTYVLKGDIARLSGVTGSSISMAMSGDDAAASVSSAGLKKDTNDIGAAGVNANASNNFIWSDLNYGLNSTTATITAEWTNGYLIINTTTQSLNF